MRALCVVYMWLEPTSVNENTTNLERELCLCLALAWRWSDVLLASILTREKTLRFFNMQKMCAEVDAHDKWITFIRRSRQIIFWRTPSESQRTDLNSSFFCALDVRDGMCDCALKSEFAGLSPALAVRSQIMFLLRSLLKIRGASQQTQYIHPMLDKCWTSVLDGGYTLIQHRVDVSCFPG